MTKLRLGALFMVLSLGFGCGRSGIGSPGSSATAADFCNSAVDPLVAFLVRCGGSPERYWSYLHTSAAPAFCAKINASLAAGTITYDRANGAECLVRLNQLDCNSIDSSGLDSCSNAFTGRLPVGSQCSYLLIRLSTDCAPGNYCSYTSDTCGGTCKPYVQSGGPCAYTSECAPGSSCQYSSSLCVSDVDEGQACRGPSAGDCSDGLYCEGATTSPGTCRKKKTSGACTTYGSECAEGYVCAGPANAKTCTRAKQQGDSCTQGQSECFALGFCDDEGKCTLTGMAENQFCGGNPQGEFIRCGTDLYCVGGTTSGTMGTCKRTKPAGLPCTSSYSGECAGVSSICDPTNKVCVACN